MKRNKKTKQNQQATPSTSLDASSSSTAGSRVFNQNTDLEWLVLDSNVCIEAYETYPDWILIHTIGKVTSPEARVLFDRLDSAYRNIESFDRRHCLIDVKYRPEGAEWRNLVERWKIEGGIDILRDTDWDAYPWTESQRNRVTNRLFKMSEPRRSALFDRLDNAGLIDWDRHYHESGVGSYYGTLLGGIRYAQIVDLIWPLFE